jgi:hypothetical protein
MTALASARKNCPMHNGHVALVRDAMKRYGSRMSVYMIGKHSGLKTDQVKRALRAAMDAGGVYKFDGGNGTTYYTLERPDFTAKAKSKNGSGQFAGRITYPQFRYGSSRLG